MIEIGYDLRVTDGSACAPVAGSLEVGIVAPSESEIKNAPWTLWFEEARKRRFSALQRYSGRGIGGRDGPLRAAALVEAALGEESAGRPLRAGFYWRTAHAALPEAWLDDQGWKSFVGQVLWPLHWALVRGRLGGTDAPIAGDAIWKHADWIEALAAKRDDLAAADQEELSALRMHRARAVMATSPSEAVGILKSLHEASPGNRRWVLELAEAYIEAAGKALNTKSATASAIEKVLHTIVEAMARLREETCELRLVELEARLRQALAVQMANQGSLEKALVEQRKALILDPNLDNAGENWEGLVQAMKSLQRSADDTRERLRQNSQLTLNAEGQSMLRVATTGFQLVNEFAESEAAVAMETGRHQAILKHCWTEAGGTDFAHAGEAPQAVLTALSEVLDEAPPSPSEVRTAWRQRVEAHPELRPLPVERAEGYLLRRLFPDDPGTPARHAEPEPQLWAAPKIAPAARRASRDKEPFQGWLYSREDSRVKLQCALAIVAVLVFGVMSLREWRNGSAAIFRL